MVAYWTGGTPSRAARSNARSQVAIPRSKSPHQR